EHDREQPDTHLVLGLLLAAVGKWSEAIPQFEKVVELKPNTARAARKQELALYHLGLVLTTCPDPRHRDPKRAASAAPQLIDLGFEVTGWTILGLAQYRQKDYRGCLESLEKAIATRKSRDGGDASYWLVQAMAHWQLGNRDESRALLRRSVKWLEGKKATDE